MELLNKIADAFDPKNAANAVTQVMKKVSDTVNDIAGSHPEINSQKINSQETNTHSQSQPLPQPQSQPIPQPQSQPLPQPQSQPLPQPQSQPQSQPLPQPQSQPQSQPQPQIIEENAINEITKIEEILSNPKYKDYIEAFENDKLYYESIVQELSKMESVRFSYYKNLYDLLHGVVIDDTVLIETNIKINEQNELFQKYTKLSELYWKMLNHPLYGKLIPVKFPNEDVNKDKYYYTANGIIYYKNNKSFMIDPYVMYFTYFYKIRDNEDSIPEPVMKPMSKSEPDSVMKPMSKSEPVMEPMSKSEPDSVMKPVSEKNVRILKKDDADNI